MADRRKCQTEVAVHHCTPLANLKIKLVQTFATKAELVRGCDITTDCKILLTDCLLNKRLIGSDRDRKHLFTISTDPYRAIDVTCIDDTTVAVTSGWDRVISIEDISSRTVKKHIDVGYYCWGVTYREGTLLVCAEDHGILSINLANEKIITIIQCDDLPSHSYITTYRDRLYYTNCKSKTVTCCDMEGNTIWTFKDADVLPGPRGITTDNEGRVYVCERDNVIGLSNDGKQSKTLIPKADGLDNLFAIHFDKKRNILLLTNLSGRVFLFHLLS